MHRRWKDNDIRSRRDATGDGRWPIPDDYEGPLSTLPRIVRVLEFDDKWVLVENEHDGRQSRIQRKAFHDRPELARGFIRA